VDLLARRGSLAAARRRLSRPGAVSRARAAELLGSVEDGGVVTELSAALGDRSQEVRGMAARALGLIGDPAAARPLLARLTGRRSVPRPLLAYTLVRLGSGAAPALIDGLGAEEPAMRGLAAEVLGLIGDVSAAGPLVRAVNDDRSDEVRARAARSLGILSAPSGLPCLLELLGPSHSQALRAAAAAALGDLQAREAGGRLDEALDDPDSLVGHLAAVALLGSGPDGRARLEARRDDGSRPRARAQACEVLAIAGLGHGPPVGADPEVR
ncbi:MAG: HEAT repeat domain-containing protein, partial [Acidimicrobiales bacterium]